MIRRSLLLLGIIIIGASANFADEYHGHDTSPMIGAHHSSVKFKAVRVFPKLEFTSPIFVITEPGTKNLLMISESPTKLLRIVDVDSTPPQIEDLLTFKDVAAYTICPHPNYEKNGFLYLGVNGAKRKGSPKESRVVRYTVDRTGSRQLVPDSAKTIIEWESNGHNGLGIAFGLDGMMYVTSGDGTSDSDTNIKGQGLEHLLSKVLRIDVDQPSNGKAYSIPKDNPYVGQARVAPETYAYGLRNPWRMSTDPKTGNIFIGNNGQDLWEQVYLVRPKANYGWSVYEGGHPFYLNRKLGPDPHTLPVADHPHSEARSLTGGVTYHGKQFPELQGAYIYGDYSTGKIWGIKLGADDKVVWHQELADSALAITSFGIAPDGELLITDHRGGKKGALYGLTRNKSNKKKFPEKLSDTGLFASVKDHRLHDSVIPYDVNAPLWSDGAIKSRWLALPKQPDEIANKENKGNAKTTDNKKTQAVPKIGYSARGSWSFPDGTVIVKSFALEPVLEGQPNRRIETRLLVKDENEWLGFSYAWNPEQTEAFLVSAKGDDKLYQRPMDDGTANLLRWRFPSRAECMVCHSRAARFVLGLSTAQLNRTNSYHGKETNQLDHLESLEVIKIARPKKDADPLPKFANPYNEKEPLEARARAYLHANCAQCHVQAGGGNSQIDLASHVELGKMKAIEEKPLHHKFDLKDPRIIAAGDPGRSVLLHRLKIRGRGQMPQLATNIVDKEAVKMLGEWIQTLKPVEQTNKK